MGVVDTAVVLPGLDGTGLLLDDFVSALETFCAVRLVRYPASGPMSYPELAAFVRARLPAGDHVVIGESFAGPLALDLALEPPPGLKGVVLGASFARLDLPLKRTLAALIGRIPVRHVPTRLLTPLLLGRWSTPSRRRSLAQALSQVPPDVLAMRAKAALGVDLLRRGGTIGLPVLYLRASSDRLIPASAAGHIAALAPTMTVQDIAAPHFLFQVEPGMCAEAVRQFCRALAGPMGWKK